MTPGQRVKYFRDFWPAACAANGWSPRDDAKRKAVTLEAMACVRGPQVSSSHADFGANEVTALFCYLEFLAHPDDLDRSARWVDCQTDYRAYNRARQADWHEAQAYGPAGSKKLRRERFAGARSAAGEPLEKFDPAAIRKRHMTMASRHQKKARVLKNVTSMIEDPAERECVTAGQNPASQNPASPDVIYLGPAAGEDPF